MELRRRSRRVLTAIASKSSERVASGPDVGLPGVFITMSYNLNSVEMLSQVAHSPQSIPRRIDNLCMLREQLLWLSL